MNNKNIYYIYLGINLLFPLIFIPINFFLIFYTKNIKVKDLKILLFNISYSFSVLAFLYTRNDSDVYNYSLMYEIAKKTDDLNLLIGELQYYSWSVLLKVFSYYNLNFQYINMFCVFLFYFCTFYNLMFVHSQIKDLRAFKFTLLRLLLVVSIFTITQSYRNPLAFSIVMTGIILLESRKKKLGIMTILFGVGYHYSTIFLLLIYILSKFIKFKKYYLIVSFLLFFIANPIILNVIAQSLGVAYFISKIDFYTSGQWATRDYSNNAVALMNIGILVSLFLYIYFLLYYNDKKDANLKKYKSIDNIKNFILLYIIFVIPLASYRTILDRYLFGAGGFILALLSYIIFSDGNFFKKKSHIIVLIIWISYIDPYLLVFIYSDNLPYTFNGESLFLNFFYSPIFNLI